MKKLKFSTFDPYDRRALFEVAREANVPPPFITAGASSLTEIYESLVFLTYYVRGSVQHEQLSARLREWMPTESITDCISRIAPAFHDGYMQSVLGESQVHTEYDETCDQVWDALIEWRISTTSVQ